MKNGGSKTNGLKTRQFNFRFSEFESEQLRALSEATGFKMADVLRILVSQAHARLGKDGVREMKEHAAVVEKMRERILEIHRRASPRKRGTT